MEALTKDEQAHLDRLEKKMDMVRAVVRGLVKDWHTGLFLWGEGGSGKSFTVITELMTLKAKYILHNSRLTARGLVDELARCPNDIHLIEDAETLLDDKKAPGVLRSALHSQSRAKPPVRRITWKVFKNRFDFDFTGKIIVISNANLADELPEIRAIKTRINVLHLDVSNDELLALMKTICLNGYRYGCSYLAPDECWEVAEYIRDNLAALHRPLDLRLLDNGFRDYLQWKHGDSGKLHWRDLLQSRMREAVSSERYKRADRIADEARLAFTIDAQNISKAEKIRQWEEKTGHKGERSFYRRLKDYDNGRAK